MAEFVNMNSGGGDAGYPYNCTSINRSSFRDTVTISWVDPINGEGAPDPNWRGTKIVGKIGAYPENVNDGVQYLDSKIFNQYSENGFKISGLTYDQTYYFQLFPYSDEGTGNSAHNRAAPITPWMSHVWGVRHYINNPSTILQRLGDAVDYPEPVVAVDTGTGSSPFDAFLPWRDMRLCNQNTTTGAITAFYGDASFSFTSDACMVYIPKFWCKFVHNAEDSDPNNHYNEYWISDDRTEGFEPHPTFARGGNIGDRDYITVGRYKRPINSGYSISGENPYYSASPSHSYNATSGFGYWDFTLISAIQLLYLVEFANLNSQETISNGITASFSTSKGETDAMNYHTGIIQNTYVLQYRWVEGIFGGGGAFADGIVFSNGSTSYCKDPTRFTNGPKPSGYDALEFSTPNTMVGYATKLGYSPTNPHVFVPIADGGSESTYFCDHFRGAQASKNTSMIYGRGVGNLTGGSGIFSCSSVDQLQSSGGSHNFRYMCTANIV